MRFQNGLHTDLYERLQPQGTYRDLKNGVFDLAQSSIRNEIGTSKVTLIPYTPIGSIVLNNGNSVIFSTDLVYSSASIYVDVADGVIATHTITINGTDVGKTDVTVTVSVTAGMTIAQTATAYYNALLASTAFLALYRAEVSGSTVTIKTLNGTASPASFNTISITVSSSNGAGSLAVVASLFVGGDDSIRDSAIGIFDGTTYTPVYDDHGNESTSKFNFQSNTVIEGTSRVNADLDTLIYWTDDYNVPRFANITTPLSVGFDINLLDLFPFTDKIGFFTLDSINTGGGSLSTGAYYISAAYVDEDGTRSNYFLVSPPIFVNDDPDSSSPDTFDGSVANTPTNKSITFSIDNLDENHTYVRISVVKDGAVTTLPNIPIPSGGNLSYTYTGNESVIDGDLTEIVVDRLAYAKARTMKQLDSRLYLGNLKGRSDIGYQRYANNIKVQCVNKTINGQGSLNFKDGKVAIESRSFRRDEVYALYIAWVLNDGSETKAYHIPGRRAISGGSAVGSITFNAAPSSFTQSSGNIAYSGTLDKATLIQITINGTDTTKTDVTVSIPVAYEFAEDGDTARVVAIALNANGTFAAEYVAIRSGVNVIIKTLGSVTDPAAYNTISISHSSMPGMTATPTSFSGGVDSATASYGAGVKLLLDGANTVTSASISGQETGASIATKMETALLAAGSPWTGYTILRIGDTISFTALATGSAYNRVLSFSANSIASYAGSPTAGYSASYTDVITVAGVAGTFQLTIDGDPYPVAFNTDVGTTIDDWITAHQATLAGISISSVKSSVSTITIASITALTTTDTSSGGMSATIASSQISSLGIGGGGGYFESAENAAVSASDSEVADLSAQDGSFPNSKLFHFSGVPDGDTNMAYWENRNEVYPTGSDWKIYDVVGGVGVDTGSTNESLNVRHHKFPDADNERFFEGTTTSSQYSVLGIKLSDIKIPDELSSSVKGFKIYYAERNSANKTILDQGLILYGAFNTTDQVTQNRASNIAKPNLFDRKVLSCHPFKAMAERTNIGALSFAKAVAKVNPVSLTDNRAGITVYAAPSGDSTVGLHTDGEPLVREIIAKGYIPALTDNVGINSNGFTESNYQNGHGESKVLLELGNDMPEFVVSTGNSVHNYLMNLCMFKEDVYLSFKLQNLVWTGYWQESVDALATGDANRQHLANETAEIYGGDTFIGFQSHKVHASRFTKILTVSGGSGTLGVDIDSGYGVVAYDEAFASNIDTTITNWIATHSANLAALGNPVIAKKTGTTEITLICDYPITVADGGATVTFEQTTGDGLARKVVAVSGSSGTLSLKINGVIYSEAYSTSAAVTATNWIATHATALGALSNIITAFGSGSAEITLQAVDSFTVQDVGSGMVSAITNNWSVLMHDLIGESDYNFGMRHEGVNAWEKYYPKSSRASVITPPNYPAGISADEDVDNYWGYDPSFSFLANVKYPLPFDGSSITTELPNRIIRSSEDTGGIDDTFREFLPNDYLDLPKSRGELIKIQNIGQVLIPHMERGLLRTRGREELNTSGINAFIGSGDIFSVRPDEIVSIDLGYGGLQDQKASLVTELGYVFVDRLAGKVFLLSDSLEEISAYGMKSYFAENLDGGGILSVTYDPELKRIIITKSGSSTTDFTISYLPEIKKWISFHNYTPTFYVYLLDKLYSYNLGYLNSHNSGTAGTIYENIVEFDITFVENQPLEASKQLAALIIDTTSLDGSTENRKDTFNKVKVTNSYQDTGLKTLTTFPTTGWNIRRTKRSHKVNQLRDTLNIPTTSQFESWALQKRLVDNYHKVRLVYSNTNGYTLHLFNAELSLRPAKR